jgi:hypothetical protein
VCSVQGDNAETLDVRTSQARTRAQVTRLRR